VTGKRKVFTGRAAQIFNKAASAIIPPGGPFPQGADDALTLARADALAAAFQPAVRWSFPLLMLFLQYSALAAKGKTFTQMPLSARASWLDELEHSRIYAFRGIAQVLKLVTCLSFYDDDAVCRAIGCLPDCAVETRAFPKPQPPEFPKGSFFAFADYPGNVRASCDVVVVGSGAGGAVVAKELAEKGLSVILVEEGALHTVADYNSKAYSAVVNMYRDGASTSTIGTPAIPTMLGRCVGGTTAINSATCFRTPEGILEKWRSGLGLDHLTPENLEPVFERIEKAINVTELSWDILGRTAQIVKQGADALGLNCRPLKHNVKNCRGCGVCQYGCPEGAKQSMDVTFVPEAARLGAKIFSCCRVTDIVKENGRAAGVRARIWDPATGREHFSAHIRAKKVVLACGTLLTPSLLMRAGLKNPNIGRNLQIHPAGRVVAEMGERVEGWKGVSQGVFVDDFAGEGIMLEGIFVPPGLLLAGLPGTGFAHKEMACKLPYLAPFGVMIHDSTKGRVFRDVIQGKCLAAYQILQSDVDKFKKGVALAARIFFAAGAKRLYTGISKVPVLEGPEGVERLLAANVRPHHVEMMAFHPLGTCRMAAGPAQGVVGKDGQSFDLPGLYIADGSVVPSSLGVNPQITIMAFAAMIADGIAKQ
jgi:choline dehydrogenase-like flavoprotein